ncbi:response regulator transcription factor [Pannonibacter sp. Q-1]|uniref:LuxR family transcriptional regulator n=1 Tax=Pannonibacter phragmitetus TaxID=121719 RepID=A0A0L0J1X1_9HYPH|nr:MULTISPECIES: response regulator transcription factor [Pannonibacter]ALV27191.1 LuxR family transcriptional regulator [Pannonibacter phragmitetus]KND19666.1 LuxR family transcriptional regulator [Pannonibacter phragmitetus]MBA4206963.1 two-component system response regulator UvrY [Polymorphum sp.]
MTSPQARKDDLPRKVRVLLADDHELVRAGIRARLEGVAPFEIVGEATDGRMAVQLAETLRPDIILMDISMPGLNGLEATETIRRKHPMISVLVLSIYDNPEYVRGVMQSGARGYLLKDISAKEMINAILAVADGGYYFSSRVGPALMENKPSPSPTNPYGLTEREREVLQGVARGQANKEIAVHLGISVRTVESHRLNIRDKVGSGNAAHLYRIAQELRLV